MNTALETTSPAGATPPDALGLFDRLAADDYEQVLVLQNHSTGLRGFLAIHDTTLGPAFGGVRIKSYPAEQDALEDALRLARSMTYKCSLAGLSCGGGKTVLLEHPGLRRDAALEAFGAVVESLRGRYFCARDVGMTESGLAAIARATQFVARDPAPGLGDISEHTAIGVWHALRAALLEAGLRGKLRVALQGTGAVGTWLARILAREGFDLLVADADESRAAAVAQETHARLLAPEEIHSADADVFAPCALGGVLNRGTIPQLEARVVCGCANNVLAAPEDAEALAARGILYVPDYLANAGGVIRLADYFLRARRDSGRNLAAIFSRTRKVIRLARERGITTARAAAELAEMRLTPRKTFRDVTWQRKLRTPA